MAVTVGTAGSSATPATDLYNLLATAMTANGNWTEQSDSPVSAVNAGTVDIVRVWKCTGGVGAFYLFIEVDNTNARLRFRISEYWDTTGHKLRQPAGGGTAANATDNTSVTPTANGTVTDSDTTIGSTNPNVSFVEVKVLGTAYNYLYEVRNNLMTVASRVSATNYFCIVGCFNSLVQSLSDTSPFVLLGHMTNPGLSGTAGSSTASNNGRFTRMPGLGAVSTAGAFCCGIVPLISLSARPNAALANYTSFKPIGGSATTNPWYNNLLVFPAILHGLWFGEPGNRFGMRGYLQNFVTGFYVTEPSACVDTLTIGGLTYYPLGKVMDYTGASAYVAIKG